MNFEQYKPLALRTEKPLATSLLRLQHASLGLTTEHGEFTTEVKRLWAYQKPLTQEMREHIFEELGDILWYVAIGADALDFEIPEYQHLFDFDLSALPLAEQLQIVANRISVEIGFFTYEVPLHQDPRARTGAMRSLVNILSGVAHACDALDMPLEEVMSANIAKLKQRFPDAYTNAAAEARADKGGLDARNS
ncbi:nucleoside triphosphate pyrophosphohydrolase family protein [Burkholderia pseudomallei]